MRHWEDGTRRAGAWLAAVLGLAGVLAACSRDPAHAPSAAGSDTLSVRAEFVYLPDQDRMVAVVTPESTVVERRNARDSLLSAVRKANTPESKVHYDSAVHCFRKAAPGEYRRDHVIDGTRIRLSHRGREIFCDNCLHDFVLEAAGASGSSTSRNVEMIRGTVRSVSSMVMLAEGKSGKGMRVLSVTLDKSQMRDTARSYQVDNPSAGVR